MVYDGDERYAEKAWQLVVGVTAEFGGGSQIGVGSAQDGRLDVAIVPAGSRLDGAAQFNVDGELCGCNPPRFAGRPRGFELIVP